MRAIFISTLLIATLLLMPVMITGNVSAVTDTFNPIPEECQDPSLQGNTVCQPVTNTDPVVGNDGIIMKIANIMAWFGAAIAVIMIMFAGFRLAKSSGDSSKVTQARETIIYALIGLVVIIAARFIVGFVISKL